MSEVGAAGLIGVWAQADVVGKSAAVLLLAMSVATWYLIVTKALATWRVRRGMAAAQDGFWSAPDLARAIERMQAQAPESPFTAVALEGAAARDHHERHARSGLSAALDYAEFMTRALRRSVQRASSGLDAGLSVLASIGATSPFVGLFGTVWGIYHALIGIGFTGQATIDKVAGPVGEALIMTAFGIAVAVPAVLAYNAFLRANRVIREELDGFAHDLHAYFTTGAPMNMGADEAPPARSAGEGR